VFAGVQGLFRRSKRLLLLFQRLISHKRIVPIFIFLLLVFIFKTLIFISWSVSKLLFCVIKQSFLRAVEELPDECSIMNNSLEVVQHVVIILVLLHADFDLVDYVLYLHVDLLHYLVVNLLRVLFCQGNLFLFFVELLVEVSFLQSLKELPESPYLVISIFRILDFSLQNESVRGNSVKTVPNVALHVD